MGYIDKLTTLVKQGIIDKDKLPSLITVVVTGFSKNKEGTEKTCKNPLHVTSGQFNQPWRTVSGIKELIEMNTWISTHACNTFPRALSWKIRRNPVKKSFIWSVVTRYFGVLLKWKCFLEMKALLRRVVNSGVYQEKNLSKTPSPMWLMEQKGGPRSNELLWWCGLFFCCAVFRMVKSQSCQSCTSANKWRIWSQIPMMSLWSNRFGTWSSGDDRRYSLKSFRPGTCLSVWVSLHSQQSSVSRLYSQTLGPDTQGDWYSRRWQMDRHARHIDWSDSKVSVERRWLATYVVRGNVERPVVQIHSIMVDTMGCWSVRITIIYRENRRSDIGIRPGWTHMEGYGQRFNKKSQQNEHAKLYWLGVREHVVLMWVSASF